MPSSAPAAATPVSTADPPSAERAPSPGPNRSSRWAELLRLLAALLWKWAARLDARRFDARSSRPGTSRAPRGALEKRRVLLVEDDPAHAELITAILDRQGFVVASEENGVTGVQRAQGSPFDLILLDVMMPALDGFAVAAALRSDERTRDIPILFLSACDEVHAKVRGLSLGAVDYLAKPFHGAELLARIERVLEAREANRQLKLRAELDALTGLANFRALDERLGLEWGRAKRYGLPLAVAMIDVDQLKRVNDEQGHARGNDLLARLARVLRAEIRETDLAARYGGDEFVVILPHTAGAEARLFGERVLRRLAEEPGPVIGVSIGIASFEPGQCGSEAELLAQADRAAYHAKRGGGRRLCVHDPSVVPLAGLS